MTRRRFAILLIISLLIVLATGFAIYLVIGIGKGTLRWGGSEVQRGQFVKKEDNRSLGKWNEGVIEYNGEKYIYNSNCRIYLLMGVDRSGPATAAEDHVSGGQSDAMFLLITDSLTRNISVIPINRNTMTDIRLCDKNGNYYGTFTAQICLQHGYGDGMKESCQKTLEAVSNLFYDIPINGYIAMNMDAMMILNHLAGGVTVEVLENIDYPALNVHLTEGETVTLSDEEAYAYLRSRDNEFGAADKRLDREMQYSLGLYEGLKKAAGGNRSKALDMYEQLESYIVTNIVFADIVEDLLKYGFDQSHIYTVPGKLVQGKKYEEFYIDKNSLYDTMITILYKKQ